MNISQNKNYKKIYSINYMNNSINMIHFQLKKLYNY